MKIQPGIIAATVPAGRSVSAVVSLVDAIADPDASIRLEQAEGIAINSITQTWNHLRVLTPEELLETPNPPRESLRGKKVLVRDQENISVNITNNIPAGAKLDIQLQLSAPANADQIRTGKLVLSGSNWARAEVPIAVMLQRNTLDRAEVVPQELRANLPRGMIQTLQVSIPQAPSAATLFAMFEGDSFFHSFFMNLEKVLVLRPRPGANGQPEFLKVAESNGRSPVSVLTGDKIVFEIQALTQEENHELGIGSLRIVSNAWEELKVPIQLVSGWAEVSLDSSFVKAIRGEVSVLTAFANLHSGPGMPIDIKLGDASDPWTSFPERTAVMHDSPSFLRQDIMINVRPDAPLGKRQTVVEFSLFNDIVQLRRELEIDIAQQPVDVFVTRRDLQGLQGAKITGSVGINSRGGRKRITIWHSSLPDGVSFTPRIWEHDGVISEPLDLNFDINEFAQPGRNLRIALQWKTDDGAFGGMLEFRVSIAVQLQTRVLTADVVTPDGVALGGHVRLELRSDGTAQFSGSMRATGALSYHFRLLATLRSPDGALSYVARKEGEVFGTFDSGNREFVWDEAIAVPQLTNNWREMRNAALSINRASELIGIADLPGEAAKEFAQFVIGTSLLSAVGPGAPGLAALVLLGAEAGSRFGLEALGPTGPLGLISAAGVAALAGPGYIIPAYVAGVLATEVMVKFRRMTADEIIFADQVFKGTIPYERIWLTNVSNPKGTAFVMPGHDHSIIVNITSAAFETGPMEYSDNNYPAKGKLFIHELTHAWQIAHQTFAMEPFWNAIFDRDSSAGNSPYIYGPPGPNWSEFNIEQQGSIVDDWYSGQLKRAAQPFTDQKFTAMGSDSPYTRYIEENIRQGSR